MYSIYTSFPLDVLSNQTLYVLYINRLKNIDELRKIIFLHRKSRVFANRNIKLTYYYVILLYIFLKSKHVNLSWNGIFGKRTDGKRIGSLGAIARLSYYKKSIYRIFLSRLDGKEGSRRSRRVRNNS